jgi:hypothetical protein
MWGSLSDLVEARSSFLRAKTPRRNSSDSVFKPQRRYCGETRTRVLAARCARVLRQVALLRWQRAQGRPGARCTRGLVCNVHKEVRTRAYRFSGEHPAFPAQWFTAYNALSPVTGFVATVAPEKRLLLTNLTPASGRQDHTTSPSASATLVFVTSASTASHRNVRDDRDPPLMWVRRAERNH